MLVSNKFVQVWQFRRVRIRVLLLLCLNSLPLSLLILISIFSRLQGWIDGVQSPVNIGVEDIIPEGHRLRNFFIDIVLLILCLLSLNSVLFYRVFVLLAGCKVYRMVELILHPLQFGVLSLHNPVLEKVLTSNLFLKISDTRVVDGSIQARFSVLRSGVLIDHV